MALKCYGTADANVTVGVADVSYGQELHKIKLNGSGGFGGVSIPVEEAIELASGIMEVVMEASAKNNAILIAKGTDS